MEIKKDVTSLYDFEAWSGGKDTKAAIIAAGKANEAWAYIDELFGDCGEIPTETAINDYLWFESEELFKELGIENEEEEAEEEEEE